MRKIRFSHRFCIFTLIMLWILCAQTISATEQSHNEFYLRLTTWSKAPSSHQIDSLKHFTELYPDYQPAYLKLEEQFLFANQSDKLKKYFRALSRQSQNYSNAQWMLGRYFKFADEPDKAMHHFENAISDKNIPYQTLYDYQELAYHNKQFEKAELFLNKFEWSEKQRTLMQAHALILKEQYDEAIMLFQSAHPFNDFSVDLQYYRSLYKSYDPDAALQIAQEAQLRARKEGCFFYEELFFLATMKCRYLKDNTTDLSSDIQTLHTMLKRSNNIRVKTQLTKFQAYLAMQSGEHENALLYNKEVLEHYKKFHNWRLVTRCYQDIAATFYARNQNVFALQNLEKSLKFADRFESHEMSAWAWRQYGVIYRDLTQYALAETYFEKAKQAALKTANPNVLENIDRSIRELRALQASPSRAVQLYKKQLADIQNQNLKTDIFFPTYSLAQTFDRMGEYDQAQNYYKQAFLLAQQQDNLKKEAWAQAGVAGTELYIGDMQKALADLHNVKETAELLNDSDLIWLVHMQLGKFYEKQEHIDEAIHHYKRVIDQSEIKRKELKAGDLAIGFLSERQEAYQRLSECYYKKFSAEQNSIYLDNIFYYEELRRARMFKDELNNIANTHRPKNSESVTFTHLYSDFQRLQRRLRDHRNTLSQSALDSLISQLQLYKYDIVNEKIRMGNMDSTRSKNRSLPRLIDVQRKLTHQTAIFYHITDQQSFALVVQPDTCTIVPLSISPDELDSLVTIIMHPLHHIENNDVLNIPFHAEIAYELYNKLFRPVEKQCSLSSQLLIIPTGLLANLPFDILLDQKPAQKIYTPHDRPDYTNFFLNQDYEFYYCPSTHLLLRPSLTCSPSMLIIADPFKVETEETDKSFTLRLRTGWRFDPLPYAHVEASAIKHFLKESIVLRNENATEEKVRELASKYSILHIASHAFVDTTFDIFSGLALADGKNNDGLLMGFEIAGSQFPCNLVTLSACETGRGKLINGEGVLGLPRQFLLAGSRSVIMSKWKVDDKFTATFMPKFYEYFIQNGLSKAAALAKAKREILAEMDTNADYHYQHPFFWASFNLYGDAGIENEVITQNHLKPNYLLIVLSGIIVSSGVIFFLLIKRRRSA